MPRRRIDEEQLLFDADRARRCASATGYRCESSLPRLPVSLTNPDPDPSLSVEVRPLGDAAVRVAVSGEIDVASAPRLEEHLERELSAGRDVELDLAQVSFIDSSGIRVLIGASRGSAEGGGAFALCEPLPDQVRRVLELTGVLAQLALTPSADADRPSGGEPR